MVILLGVLMGLLAFAAVYVSYLRQEIAAHTGPRLRRSELRLGTVSAELNLATKARLPALNKGVLHA
jgi:hypothetical protein